METKEEEYFTNKLEDKKLRAKLEKLTIENPRDTATLEIILKQKFLSKSQREWLFSLLKRKGLAFSIMLEKKT